MFLILSQGERERNSPNGCQVWGCKINSKWACACQRVPCPYHDFCMENFSWAGWQGQPMALDCLRGQLSLHSWEPGIGTNPLTQQPWTSSSRILTAEKMWLTATCPMRLEAWFQSVYNLWEWGQQHCIPGLAGGSLAGNRVNLSCASVCLSWNWWCKPVWVLTVTWTPVLWDLLAADTTGKLLPCKWKKIPYSVLK